MALAITRRRKPKTVGRNPWAPRADRLIYAYNMQDASGTSLDNVGTRGDLHPTNWDASLINTPTWVTDADEGPVTSPPANVVRCTQASAEHVSIPCNSGEQFDRFTYMVRFKWADTQTNVEALFNSSRSTASGDLGGVHCQVSGGSDEVFVKMRDLNNDLYAFFWDISASTTDIHTLIVTGGEFGFYAWLDGEVPETYEVNDVDTTVPTYIDDLTTDGPMRAGAGSTNMWLNRNAGGGANSYADMDYYAFAMWDVQLEQFEVDKVFADPYIPWRTMADISLLDEICPYIWDVDDSVSLQGAKFVCKVKSGAAGSPGIRLTYSTDPMVFSSETPGTVSSHANGSAGDQVEIPLIGLASDTVYYAIAEQIDAAVPTDYHPLPIGRIKFKTQGTGACFVVHADDHFNIKRVTDTSPDNTTIQGKDIVDNSIYPTRLGNWHGIRDMEQNAAAVAGAEIDLFAGLGDDIFTGNASNEADVKTRCIDYRNQNAMAHALGQRLRIGGNHEAEANYHRYEDDGVTIHNQKFATIHRKDYFPAPDNDVGAASQAEWIEGLTDTDTESTAGVDADTTANSSPLQNFFVKTIGNTDLFFLDVYRYTGNELSSDSDHGEHTRPSAEWRFGDTQKTWLASKLAASTAKWKFILIHHLPGGEAIGVGTGSDFYGRGSGRVLSSVDELWILNQCKSNAVTSIIKAHDHRFAHVRNSGVNIVTCPSLSAPSLNRQGWHWTEMDASYGTAFAEGGVSGVRKMLNIFGYLIVRCTDTACTIYVRNTWMSTGDSAYSNNIDNGLYEHWQATELIENTGSAGSLKATLPERPKVVFSAIDEGDYGDGFWSAGLVNSDVNGTISGTPVHSGGETTVVATASIFTDRMVGATVKLGTMGFYTISEYTNPTTIKVTGDASSETGAIFIAGKNYHIPVGPDEWDGAYRTPEIDIEDGGTGRVAIAAVPRTVHSMQLTNADDDSLGIDNQSFSGFKAKGGANMRFFGGY